MKLLKNIYIKKTEKTETHLEKVMKGLPYMYL